MTETTTAPVDPAAAATKHDWTRTLIADIDGVPDDLLAKLLDADIEWVGDIWETTLEGVAWNRMADRGFGADEIEKLKAVVTAAQAKAERDAEDEAERVAEAENKLPEPTRGENGYKFTVPVKLGSVTFADKVVSTSVAIPISGEDGIKGLPPAVAHDLLCGRQIDVEIRQQGQNEIGAPAPFHGVCTTAGLSFGANRKGASVTLSFPGADIDGDALKQFRKMDVEIRINPANDDDPEDDEVGEIETTGDEFVEQPDPDDESDDDESQADGE